MVYFNYSFTYSMSYKAGYGVTGFYSTTGTGVRSCTKCSSTGAISSITVFPV